jgi:glycosyltransferase involved in cell wall biosynthesis
MRIAQVAPLYERVPPRHYGGTERVVSYLTEELVRLGHAVTLFASGDSVTAAKLVAVWDRALRLDDRLPDANALHVLMLEQVCRRAREFDIIHFHLDSTAFPLARRIGGNSLFTLHGRQDLAGLQPLFSEFSELNFVSISDAQRRPLRGVNWAGTIYHGLPVPEWSRAPAADPYLAVVGRISPEKGIDKAIAIARACGVPLKIGAKVDRADRDYYEECIKPLIDGELIQFIGEVNEPEKHRLLSGALALLFPIAWPEPFGLVMIEAMSVGTPVLAFDGGSVREVIDEGVTGCVVSDVADAVRRVPLLHAWDRAACRARFEQRFSVQRMTADYCRVYDRLQREPEVLWRSNSR